MKKQSAWLDTTSAPHFPSLQGEVEVDVLVVGAGITGITTAYLLKQAGLRVAVVDQQSVGGGETGHTTAHLTFVTDTRLSEIVHNHGKDAATAFWEAGLAGMDQIDRSITAEKINCDFKVVPGYLFAATETDSSQELKSLKAEAELAVELGFDAEFIEGDPVFDQPAIRFANQLKFHPLKYLYHLANLIPGGGSHIFCSTSGSNFESKEHLLRTDQGSIAYDSLVAATHIPIQGERGTVGAALFQTKLSAFTSYAIEANIDCVPESLFWDTNDPYYYYRFEKNTEGCSVILGGEDHKTGQEVDTEACYERLTQKLQKSLPSARKPHRRWSGQVWEPADDLPYIGEVHAKQYVATGFSGNGITLGTFSALLIRDLITEKTNPWVDLFSPQRKVVSEAWRYLRENIDYPIRMVTDRLKSTTSLSELHRCGGAIVKIEGTKRAVYQDEHGKKTVLSPVCPHMGCVVAWNPAERTWDCPCHGSRFTCTGELIAGPAESGLEQA